MRNNLGIRTQRKRTSVHTLSSLLTVHTLHHTTSRILVWHPGWIESVNRGYTVNTTTGNQRNIHLTLIIIMTRESQ